MLREAASNRVRISDPGWLSFREGVRCVLGDMLQDADADADTDCVGEGSSKDSS